MQTHPPYPLAVPVDASVMPATRASAEPPATMRICGPADQQALRRLAGLDSARPLEGTILAAEIADEPLAAICVETGRVVADPFSHTAGLVDLLRSRAAQLRREKNPRLAQPGRRLRRTRAWLAGPARNRQGLITRLVLAATLAALIAAVPAAAQAPGSGSAPGSRPTVVPGELIVGFQKSSSASERGAARSRAGVRAVKSLAVAGTELVKVDDGSDTGAAAARLRRDPLVRYTEPNHFVYPAATTPNDPHFTNGGLWGLHSSPLSRELYGGVDDADIDAPEAWDLATGDSDVVVAVVDTGVLATHPDLAQRIWRNPGEIAGNGIDDDNNGKIDDVNGWNTQHNHGNTTDAHGHGTHVAGTIGATGDNGVGITGVSWSTTIMPVRVLDSSGSGTLVNIGDGFDYAGDNGADVVNASLRCFPCTASQYQLEVVRAHPGTLYVVAAGNDASDASRSTPCNLPAENVICVGATDSSDAFAKFSNFSATHVDLAAPGVEILSAVLENLGPPLFSDYFESGAIDPERWTAEGSWSMRSDALGSWIHAENDNATLTSVGSFDLAAKPRCEARWWSQQTMTGEDRLHIEWSTNGTDWTVARSDGSKVWGPHSVGLPSKDDVRLRFRFTSSGDDKIDLDNIQVWCAAPASEGAYVAWSGTSMASPHVAGAAALLLAGNPSAKVPELRSALLNEGDEVPALAGKTVTGRRLNVFNSLRRVMPPDCSAVTADPASLELATRDQFKTITLAGATDPDATTLAYKIDSVSQDEPVALAESGDDTSPDARYVGGSADSNKVELRAERNPKADGRVYRIAYTATDASHGGHCSGVETVSVPRKKGEPAVDDGDTASWNSFTGAQVKP